MVVELSFHVDLIAALRPTAARFCRLTGCIAALRICLSTERENYRSAGKSHKHPGPRPVFRYGLLVCRQTTQLRVIRDRLPCGQPVWGDTVTQGPDRMCRARRG